MDGSGRSLCLVERLSLFLLSSTLSLSTLWRQRPSTVMGFSLGASYGPGRGESEVIRRLQGIGWETFMNGELGRQ